jgi:hypothetical protein
MRHLTLNCPMCRKWLMPVLLDGLTLEYQCAEHGTWRLTPLVEVAVDDTLPMSEPRPRPTLHSHDAA